MIILVPFVGSLLGRNVLFPICALVRLVQRPVDLCTPDIENDATAPYPRLRIIAAQVDRLEAEIDAMNTHLSPLRSFILPGGSPLAAHLHLCRTTCRRAERLTVELAAHEAVNPEAIKYLNRLSDWFFVAGRIANDNGAQDVLWVPGLTRG
jgi:cob(I)alamin adenosyltransferase